MAAIMTQVLTPKPGEIDPAHEKEVRDFLQDIGPSILAITALNAPVPLPGETVVHFSNEKFAERVAEKRASKAMIALRDMVNAQGDMRDNIVQYNAAAISTDPALFKQIDAYAAAQSIKLTGGGKRAMTRDEAMLQLLDTRIVNPALDGMRAKMLTLAETPALVARRLKIGGAARRYTQGADYITEIQKMAGNPRNSSEAAGASEALKRIGVAIDRKFSEITAKLPMIAADVPMAGMPQPMLSSVRASTMQVKDAANDLIQKIEEKNAMTFGRMKP